MFKNLISGSGFHQMSKMQHSNMIGNISDHCQVVCNKKISCTKLLLKVFHQIYHLRLNGYVQRTDCLISNDHLRIYNKGSGNPDSLTLTAGKLMWVTICLLTVQTHPFHNCQDLLSSLFFCFIQMMIVQSLSDNINDFFVGIQACLWILENHLHFFRKLAALCF